MLCKALLLYIGQAPLSMPDHVQETDWCYRYKLLDMRSQNSEDFLNSNNPDALVLAILCDLQSREPEAVVSHIISELQRLHGPQLNSLRDSLMMLDILAGNRGLQNLVKEYAEMFIDVEKLGLYQLAIEKGMEKGRAQGMEQGLEQGLEQGMEQGMEQGLEQGQQEIVLRLLAKFSPEQAAEFSGLPLARVNAIASASQSF